MFNDIKSALVYIESKRTKRTLEQFKETIKKYGFNIYQKNIIHIAGTNGKGSTSSYIKDVLKTKYRVGFYSRPGMLSFNDRIRVNDEFISYKEAYRLFKLVQETYDKNNPDPNDKLSFFEIALATTPKIGSPTPLIINPKTTL